ncbi:MAG: hypothetical protein M1829_005750 [Trizodia sp. TS-e1964]|nr:MAG: hypothetical protein M1829_005750 [Trizodia sp. TS-e1964]
MHLFNLLLLCTAAMPIFTAPVDPPTAPVGAGDSVPLKYSETKLQEAIYAVANNELSLYGFLQTEAKGQPIYDVQTYQTRAKALTMADQAEYYALRDVLADLDIPIERRFEVSETKYQRVQVFLNWAPKHLKFLEKKQKVSAPGTVYKYMFETASGAVNERLRLKNVESDGLKELLEEYCTEYPNLQGCENYKVQKSPSS